MTVLRDKVSHPFITSLVSIKIPKDVVAISIPKYNEYSLNTARHNLLMVLQIVVASVNS